MRYDAGMPFQSTMPHLLTILRIAFSAFFVLLSIALCALWVRSYSTSDYVRSENPNRLEVSASRGRTFWKWTKLSATSPRAGSEYRSNKVEESGELDDPLFFWGYYSTEVVAYAPHWFFASITIALAILPWIIRRFSVRKMLIMTAIVAVFCAVVASL
jgi:hypothetical protein